MTAYFTGEELKHLLEFLLVDNPAHPGEYFPRCSGMRFRYDPLRPKFDVVAAIELGDLDRGYHAIDISGADTRLYSLTCPLYLGIILVAMYTKGVLSLVPRNKVGQPLTSRVEALDDRHSNTPYLLPPAGTVDKTCVATGGKRNCPGDQGMAGNHGSSPPLADQRTGHTAHHTNRRKGRGNPGDPTRLIGFERR